LNYFDFSCGFVTFDSIDCANKAIDEMHKKSVNGILLKVMLARRQPVIVERSNSQSSDSAAHSSTTEVWSSIAASYSQKGGLKDKRGLVSYEEMDIFASM